jgi:hypothetical protein
MSESLPSSPIETPRTAAIPLSVPQVGLAWPRSIKERVPVVMLASWARSSWVMPRFLRSWRIASPRAGWG